MGRLDRSCAQDDLTFGMSGVELARRGEAQTGCCQRLFAWLEVDF